LSRWSDFPPQRSGEKMRARVFAILLALLSALAFEGGAQARKAKTSATSKKKKATKKKTSKKSSKKKPAKKSKKSKKSSKKVVTKTKKKTSRLNMPPEWEWPPNDTMKAEGDACKKRLDELGIAWKDAPAQDKVATPIYVPEMEIGGVKITPIWRKPPFVMDCILAQAFAEQGAPALRALGVKEIRFSSIYSYREVADKPGVLSRHALGLAIDVWEFVDDAGATHVVKSDYPAGDALLHSIEKAVNDTGGYRMLLTPGNDPKHHDDHFHFEARTPGERVETPPAVQTATDTGTTPTTTATTTTPTTTATTTPTPTTTP
jgi:hypothetical protein